MSAGGKSKSSTTSVSKPLSPAEVGGYFTYLDGLSGGRLDAFAKNGTRETHYVPAAKSVGYQMLTADELRGLGGLGATRESAARRELDGALENLAADPRLSVAQHLRGKQLANTDYMDRLDAINQEREAAISQLASQERGRDYEARAADRMAFMEEAQRDYSARAANAGLTRDDLQALAEIYFGGKGQVTTSTSKTSSGGGLLGGILGKVIDVGGSFALGKMF